FSFLLAIPAIAGATLLELRKLCKATDMAYITDDMTLLQLVTGTAISAVVSFGALALLMKLIRRGKLVWFAYYLYTLGLLVVAWQFYTMVKRG
ncbi:MAG: undecaprenyl-diphosphate phosphatase, partial [Victivallaceae bacterium]|nr:undecaprenyl-diphosphate phosphatase [Victivallaceae bacterium]